MDSVDSDKSAIIHISRFRDIRRHNEGEEMADSCRLLEISTWPEQHKSLKSQSVGHEFSPFMTRRICMSVKASGPEKEI